MWIWVLYFNTLELLVRSISTSLVFNRKWERHGLVVRQSFDDHHDVLLERPSDALEVCKISLCPGSLEGFIVGKSLCYPLRLHTAVRCEVSMPSAISSSTRYSHQRRTKMVLSWCASSEWEAAQQVKVVLPFLLEAYLLTNLMLFQYCFNK